MPAVAATAAVAPAVASPLDATPVAVHLPRHANYNKKIVPQSIRRMADWIVDSSDNKDMPFVIIDKHEAKEFVFDKTGKLLGSAWVLVGLAHGDDSVPGIGDMPLTDITPEMRTTPAGRFVSHIGQDLGTLDVVWVDYKNAISMHRVINTDPAEERLKRIVSKNPAEHRISYGCINVPKAFFDKVVDPTFKNAPDTAGVVYILPEVHTVTDVFPQFYDVDTRMAQTGAGGTHMTTTALVPQEQ